MSWIAGCVKERKALVWTFDAGPDVILLNEKNVVRRTSSFPFSLINRNAIKASLWVASRVQVCLIS